MTHQNIGYAPPNVIFAQAVLPNLSVETYKCSPSFFFCVIFTFTCASCSSNYLGIYKSWTLSSSFLSVLAESALASSWPTPSKEWTLLLFLRAGFLLIAWHWSMRLVQPIKHRAKLIPLQAVHPDSSISSNSCALEKLDCSCRTEFSQSCCQLSCPAAYDLA